MEITKYKKKHKKKKIININKTFLGSLQLGCFGLKAITSGILTAKQVESIRRIIVRLTKRIGRIFIRIFFSHPLTSKGLLSRMGKGVGSIKIWISYVKKGMVFAEIVGISKRLAMKVFKDVRFRLSLTITFIFREVFNVKLA